MFSLLGHALRRLGRAPGFTALSLATLAIGIGANTAIFSVVDAVLLRPLPYPDADRLIELRHQAPGLNLNELQSCPSMFFLYREENRTFEASGIWSAGAASVRGASEPERVDAVYVTHGVLDALAVPPHLGRWFTREDDAPENPNTVILAHGYWLRRFGGDPAALGSRLLINDETREVVGVMPAAFRIADRKADLFLPYRFDPDDVYLGNFSQNGVARLRDKVSLEQASADAARMIPQLWDRFAPPPGFSLEMFQSAQIAPSFRPLKEAVVGEMGDVLWVLMGAIGVVLLIACANVANLLLVRSEGRRQELAVRAALGAGWGRIARDLLAESLLLGILGGALGLPLAHAALRLLVQLEPAGFPRLEEIGLDASALLFSLSVSFVSAVLFGLIPVFKYTRPQITAALGGGGRTLSASRERGRTRSALVVVQVALALVLMVSSGLMIRTFQALREVDPGFREPETIQTLRADIPASEAEEPPRLTRIQQAIAERLAAVPGVASVGVSTSVTLDGADSFDPIFVEEQSHQQGEIPPLRRFRRIGPGYIETLGQPLLAGRTFTWEDLIEHRDVVLASENFAREIWGDPTRAIGKRVRDNTADPWREIVGVVGDERADGLDQDAPKIIYWPLAVRRASGKYLSSRSTLFTLRSERAGTQTLAKELRETVWAVSPNTPVANMRTLGEIYERALGRTSFTLTLLGIAGAMAMLLGLIGLYGVISYTVSQRTREIGIRMALGAEHARVRGAFVRQGLTLAGIGLGVGLVVAAAAARLLTAILYGVEPLDPLTYILAALCLTAATAYASYLPARRATQVNPASALRAE